MIFKIKTVKMSIFSVLVKVIIFQQVQLKKSKNHKLSLTRYPPHSTFGYNRHWTAYYASRVFQTLLYIIVQHAPPYHAGCSVCAAASRFFGLPTDRVRRRTFSTAPPADRDLYRRPSDIFRRRISIVSPSGVPTVTYFPRAAAGFVRAFAP